MTTEVVLSAREWRKINRQNRRYRQQIKRHPEKEILVSGTCNKLKELASKTREEMVQNRQRRKHERTYQGHGDADKLR